jgi:predicted HTH transcriptional regulator
VKREPPDSLRALLDAGEGQRVEFKRHLPKERRFARLLASLANTGGGAILVGVDDDGSVRGLTDPQTVALEIEALAALLLDPVPTLEFSLGTHEGKRLLVARVLPSPRPVRLAFEDTAAYARVNDRNLAVGKVSPAAGRPPAARRHLVDAAVRQRFERIEQSNTRFTREEYARACNVSGRQARRDISALEKAFLVIEVERGIFEVLEE